MIKNSQNQTIRSFQNGTLKTNAVLTRGVAEISYVQTHTHTHTHTRQQDPITAIQKNTNGAFGFIQ